MPDLIIFGNEIHNFNDKYTYICLHFMILMNRLFQNQTNPEITIIKY